MAKQKKSLQLTYQLIADILSFDTSTDELEAKFAQAFVDWDSVVSIGSKHLILPAIYCRLKEKSLSKYLPKELSDYLEELTTLNRERNNILLQEAVDISKLFKKQNIEHVFLKGIALIAGGYFKDLGERMIGDIDILVTSNQIDDAYKLLKDEGYSNSINFNYEVKNYRHYPRLFSDDRLGAIELHNKLLRHKFDHIIDIDLMFQKKIENSNLPIPNSEFLILNTIYAHQINDHNYYLGRINLKSAYDVLILKLDRQPKVMDVLSKQCFGLRFLSLSSLFFTVIELQNVNFRERIAQKLFLTQLNFPLIGKFIFQLKQLTLNIGARIQLFFTNSSYRKNILKKMFPK